VLNGGNIVIFPPDKADPGKYNELLTAFSAPVISGMDTTRMNVSDLNTESMVFRDVFEKDASGKVTLPRMPTCPG